MTSDQLNSGGKMRDPITLLDRIFDRSGAVPRPAPQQLLREIESFVAYHPAPPDAADMPSGKGHVVLVVPAFFTTDAFTWPLRRFLSRCGYRAFGWDLGVNWGPTPYLISGLRRRLDELCAIEGGPINVVGVSLGGVLARDLVYDRPNDIGHLVTLVSPFRLPTASTLEPVVWACAPFYSAAIDPERLSTPLPIPGTAIYTREDGLVAWQSCCPDEPNSIAIEESGPHVAICRNPDVMRIVAERLAAE